VEITIPRHKTAKRILSSDSNPATSLTDVKAQGLRERQRNLWLIKRIIIINLPLVLFGCETLSLKLREENKSRVLGNRVPRRIFGPTTEEVAGGWRRLHDEDLHNLTYSTKCY
jgi:hypothetical protein